MICNGIYVNYKMVYKIIYIKIVKNSKNFNFNFICNNVSLLHK